MLIENLKLDLIQWILALKDVEVLTQVQALKEVTCERTVLSPLSETSARKENPNNSHDLVQAIQKRFANIENFELPNIRRDSLREPPEF